MVKHSVDSFFEKNANFRNLFGKLLILLRIREAVLKLLLPLLQKFKTILISISVVIGIAVVGVLYSLAKAPEWGKSWLADYGQSIGYQITYEDLNLSLLRLKAEVLGFKIADAKTQNPLFTMDRAMVNLNLWGHLTKNLDIDEVEIDAPALYLTRQGATWNWQEFITAVNNKAAEKPKKPTTSPFEYLIEKFNLTRGEIHIQDKKASFKEDITNLSLQLTELTNLNQQGDPTGLHSGFRLKIGELGFPDPKTKKTISLGAVELFGDINAPRKNFLDVDLTAKIADGTIITKSEFDTQQSDLKSDVQLKQLSLIPAIALLPTTKPLIAKSGSVSGKMNIHKQKESLKVAGDFDFHPLSVFEPSNKNELFAWNQAKVSGFEFSKNPQGQRLLMKEIAVGQPKGRLIIYEDRTTNFRELFVKDASKSTKPSTPGSQAPGNGQKEVTPQSNPSALPVGQKLPKYIHLAAAKQKPVDISVDGPKDKGPKKAFDLEIRSIALRSAEIDFTDFSIKPRFQTQIRDFTGTVLGISNQPNRYAAMAFDGKVDQKGVVNLRGQISFADPRRNNDVKLSFKRIPLKSINPYSTTFAGYEIKGGTISVNLDYKVKNADLKGDNRIVINQIQLGDEVPNYKGKSLPLKLAIALLEDGDGVIDLNIPVYGNIDNPEFSTGHVVWQAVVTVLTNIVTAPFRAIGRLLGIENFEGIFFEPGEGALSLAEKDKVENLANAMKKRTKVKLVLNGVYDPKADRENLANARIDREIFKTAGFKLGVDDPLPKLSIGDDRIQKAIGALYVQKAGRLKSLQRQVTGPSGVDKWQALRDEMIAAEPVNESQLKQLGKQRAEMIKRTLGQIDPTLASRVEIGEIKEGKATLDGITIEIDFSTVN